MVLSEQMKHQVQTSQQRIIKLVSFKMTSKLSMNLSAGVKAAARASLCVFVRVCAPNVASIIHLFAEERVKLCK